MGYSFDLSSVVFLLCAEEFDGLSVKLFGIPSSISRDEVGTYLAVMCGLLGLGQLGGWVDCGRLCDVFVFLRIRFKWSYVV